MSLLLPLLSQASLQPKLSDGSGAADEIVEVLHAEFDRMVELLGVLLYRDVSL